MLSSKLAAREVWYGQRGLLRCIVRSNATLSTGKGSSKPPGDTASSAPRHINPVDLSEEDVGNVYCLSKDEVRSIFPQGLSTKFSRMVDSLGRGCWVLRRQTYDIMNSLERFSPGKTNDRNFLLYGRDGCGKSICLSQLVHWAVKSGWMVVQVPSVIIFSPFRLGKLP